MDLWFFFITIKNKNQEGESDDLKFERQAISAIRDVIA